MKPINTTGTWWRDHSPTEPGFYGADYFKMLHKDKDDGNFYGAAMFIHGAIAGGKAGTALEVGCCYGFTLHHLINLGWTVRGFDFSPYPIEQAHPAVRPFIAVGDATKLFPDGDRAYDVVASLGMLNHVVEAGAASALSEIRRVCRGRVFITLHVADSFTYEDTEHPEARGYVWIPSEADVQRMFWDAGLHDVTERIPNARAYSHGSVHGYVLEPR